MVKASPTVRLLCVQDTPRISSKAYLNFLKEYCQQNTQLGLSESIDKGAKTWKSLNTNERSKYDVSKKRSDSKETASPEDTHTDMCGNKRQKKKSCCPMKKKSCPKKSKPRGCPRKPACPMKKKRRPACPKKRKPACPMKRKPACPRKRKPACPKKRNPCAKKRAKCSKPGPVMNNGYLNFVRSFRRKHCDLKPQELIQAAARAWCALPEEKKDRYRRMACKVTTNSRHKRRRVCTGKK